MKKNIRYRNKGYSPWNKITYSIECPNCKKEAQVKYDDKKKDVLVTCSSCYYNQTKDNFVYYKAIIKLNCPNCGKNIHKEIGKLNNKPREISTSCPECNLSIRTKPRVEKYIPSERIQEVKYEPNLGLSLWFQEEVKGNLFWAYNRDHLLEIQAYVESGLRERQFFSDANIMSMVERLPQFIKDSKNREEVLKTIKKLLNK